MVGDKVYRYLVFQVEISQIEEIILFSIEISNKLVGQDHTRIIHKACNIPNKLLLKCV